MRMHRWLYRLPLRLRSLFRSRRVEQELDEELQFHLDRQIEEHVRRGLTQEQARRAALLAMGGVDQRKEESRDARGVGFIENAGRDLCHALRSFRQNPRFALVAIFTVALGVTANTTLFNIANPILFKPLPYPNSDRLVRLYRTSPEQPRGDHSTASFFDYRDSNSVFEKLAAFDSNTARIAEPGELADRITALSVTADFFPALGVAPQVGRVFAANEDFSGAAPVVILGNIFWRERFSADPHVIGRTVRVDGQNATVIGVMPEGFEYAFLWGTVHLFRPFAFTAQQRADRASQYLRVIGRLRDGISIQTADASLASMAIAAGEKRNANDRLHTEFLQRTITSDLGRQLFAFAFAMTALVLFVACVNLANLQLARTTARAREFALRGALGGSRGRLIQQSLTESLVISVIGGIVAMVATIWLTTLLSRLLFELEPNIRIVFDVRVFAFTLLCSLLTGVLFGAFPAWYASRSNLNDVLRQNARGTTASRSQHLLRHALIAVEVTLALVVLTSAAGYIRGMQQKLSANPGWNIDGLLLAGLKLDGPNYTQAKMRADFLERLEQTVAALPGVERVALSSLPIPSTGFPSTNAIVTEERSEPPAPVVVNPVSAGYFETLGIPIIEGRGFTVEDRLNRPRVAIISQSTARRLWPKETPLGKRISFTATNPVWHEIVGVAEDVRYPASLGDLTIAPQIYRPFAQNPRTYVNLEIQTRIKPDVLAPQLRRAVASLDSDLPVYEIHTARKHLQIDLGDLSVFGDILGGFAVAGLILSGIGIFGVISYSGAQRTSEVGIRMALGAPRIKVVWAVLRYAFTWTLVGTVCGFGGAIGLSYLLASKMAWLPKPDLATSFASMTCLVVVAIAASFIPASRVSRIDPVIALRHE